METFEQQIQPFIKPLVDRIEALENENKLLKATVEELKTLSQKPNTDNKPNRTHTEVNTNKPGTTRPLTTKPVVEQKQPVNIKKQPKIPQKQPPVKTDATRTSFPVKKETKDPNETKQPKTERKEPPTKIVTSPKPVKGKEPVSTTPQTGVGKRPVVGDKPVEPKAPITKVPPPKVDNKNPKVIPGGKGKVQQPKVESKTEIKPEDKKQEVKEQPKVDPVVVAQPIAPMIQSVQITQQSKAQENKVIQNQVKQVQIKEQKSEHKEQVSVVDVAPVVQEQQVKKDQLLAQQQAQNTVNQNKQVIVESQPETVTQVQPEPNVQQPAVVESNQAKHETVNEPAQQQQQEQMI